MDTKECSKCKEEQSTDRFSKSKRCKDGLNYWCKSCMKDYVSANREKINAQSRENRKADPERYQRRLEVERKSKAKLRDDRLKYNRKYYQENKDKKLAYGKAYYEANKESCLAVRKRWKDENPDKRAAHKAKRYAAQMERRPSWANEQLINAFYKEAKRLEELTGIKFHVDHIIPMQGELVSGLDVETNLQLLPANENQSKSNKFDPMTFRA